MPTHLIRDNFVRDFSECPNCGRKGLYRYQGHARVVRKQVVGHPPGKRCKYCKTNYPNVSLEDFLAYVKGEKPLP